MRVFWAIVGVLVLVTGGLFLMSGEAGGEGGSAATGDAVEIPARAEPVGVSEVTGDPERVGVDAPVSDQVVVSTADPEIKETESVEAGLAEMGIEVVEAPVAEEDPAPVKTDDRDGEQVVLDAIVAQTTGAGGEDGAGVETEHVESDWLVGESEGGASHKGEITADAADDAVESEGDVASVVEGEASEPEADHDAAVAAGGARDASGEGNSSDADGEPSIEPAGASADGGADDGIDLADNVGGGGPLGGIGERLAQDASKAPTGPGGSVERREDGSLLVNGKIVVKGAGTEASPYELPWDLMASAGRSYAPEKGLTQLPAWAMELDGKWVRVRGYLLLPVMAADTKELLVMLNQWDGCCIGVPPSPYDAAEVRLSRSVDESVGGAGFVNYGTIKGKLDVDPYIVGGWLLGLYVIEGAEVETGSGTTGT